MATISCNTGETLFVGGCWYGAPSDDGGYNQGCQQNGNCDAYTGDCMDYFGDLCNSKNSCQPTANNANLGPDPCPGKYKFGAVAIKCQ